MATLVLVKAIIIAQQLDFRGSSLCRERERATGERGMCGAVVVPIKLQQHTGGSLTDKHCTC